MFLSELHPLQKATRQKMKWSILKYAYEDISKYELCEFMFLAILKITINL